MITLEKLRYKRQEYNQSKKKQGQGKYLQNIDKDIDENIYYLCDWMTELNIEKRPTAREVWKFIHKKCPDLRDKIDKLDDLIRLGQNLEEEGNRSELKTSFDN